MRNHVKATLATSRLEAPRRVLVCSLSLAFALVMPGGARQKSQSQEQTQELPNPQARPQSGGASTGGIFAPVTDERQRPITAGGFVDGALVIVVEDMKQVGLVVFFNVTATTEKRFIL